MMVGNRVYVGGLGHRATERDVERFFRDYGRLRDVIIKNGFGFVEFEDYRDADDAVYELNGKYFMGEKILVEFARGSKSSSGGGGGSSRSYQQQGGSYNRSRAPWMEKYGLPTRTNYRLVVENLSTRVSWQDLKDFMRQAGEVTYADAHKSHRNEGVVEFATHADMRNALLKLDGRDLHGRRVRLIDDSKSKRHSRSYSGSRSRSISRSRSRTSSRSRSRSMDRRRGSHSRSRSYSSKSRSPKSRTRSPTSRSRSPSKRSRAPTSRSRSPTSRSRSPTSRSRSPTSRSRSPTSRSKSNSPHHNDSKSPSRSKLRSRSRSRSRSSKPESPTQIENENNKEAF